MIPNFDIENFSIADAEYFRRLGFNSNDLNAGLFHEQVSQGAVIPHDTGIQRLI